MKKKILFLTVLLLLVFGIVQAAVAAGMGWGGGPHMFNGDKWDSPMKTLNLTDQQITKMREINQNNYEQTRELRIKLMDGMHELKQLQLQKNPDEDQVDVKVKEVKALRQKIQDISRQSRQQCRSLLTEEQQVKLQEFKNEKGCKGRFGAGNTQ